jgi:hypothetical protein
MGLGQTKKVPLAVDLVLLVRRKVEGKKSYQFRKETSK